MSTDPRELIRRLAEDSITDILNDPYKHCADLIAKRLAPLADVVGALVAYREDHRTLNDCETEPCELCENSDVALAKLEKLT